jgi:hypothetical protein
MYQIMCYVRVGKLFKQYFELGCKNVPTDGERIGLYIFLGRIHGSTFSDMDWGTGPFSLVKTACPIYSQCSVPRIRSILNVVGSAGPIYPQRSICGSNLFSMVGSPLPESGLFQCRIKGSRPRHVSLSHSK